MSYEYHIIYEAPGGEICIQIFFSPFNNQEAALQEWVGRHSDGLQPLFIYDGGLGERSRTKKLTRVYPIKPVKRYTTEAF